MSAMDELRLSFFQECEDLLESLSDGLREMSEGAVDGDMETVHAVFRAVHSIKGGAGAFGLDVLVTFAHVFETVLDQMRSGRMDASEEVMHTLLRAGDMLSDLVCCARDDRDPDAERMGLLLGELDAMSEGAGEDDDEPFEFVPAGLSFEPAEQPDQIAPPFEPPPVAVTRDITINFQPHGELYRTGNEPRALFRAMCQLGPTTITADSSAVVPLSDFDLDTPHLRWSLVVTTDASLDEVRAVFEFVADVALIEIGEYDIGEDAPGADEGALGGMTVTDAPSNAAHGNKLPPSLAEIRVSDVAVEGAEADKPQRFDPAATPASGPAQAIPSEDERSPDAADAVELTDEDTAVAPTDGGSQAAPPTDGPATRGSNQAGTIQKPTGSDSGGTASPPATIRVNLDRVDRLINLIGELVIMEAMLSQAVENAHLDNDSDISNGLDGIKQLASGIQESVMAIRAQPLKPIFQRMHRIIREASDATGKQVKLVTSGEATEVDKTVIERLVDPLTHMIRNSVDHGLEEGSVRAAAGKPETGTITLSAAHRSGRVIIEVGDDGGGINREKVREIAEKKGLVSSDANLGAAEIDNLLFAPGFSSKEEVSALSGRGVGLDVVRREIQALGGRVTIQSVAGEGTTFTIALPLTLAVLEGMLVEFSGEMMVLPLSTILETLRPSSATIHSIGRTGRVVANRGELIPIIDLADVFGVATGPAGKERDVLILVECEAGRRAALAVDIIHDQRQVVIKSLEENYGAVPGISAATILGDGRIALIIDPEEIIASAAPDLPPNSLAVNE